MRNNMVTKLVESTEHGNGKQILKHLNPALRLPAGRYMKCSNETNKSNVFQVRLQIVNVL